MTTDGGMIVRTWHATATPAGAGAYRRYFAGTLLPQLRDRAGFARAYLLAGEAGDGETVELTTHTFWESLDAVRSFAGEAFTNSVVEPEARAVLLTFDRTATHRTVWLDARA